MTFHFLSHISSFTIYLLYNETLTLSIVFFFLKNFSKTPKLAHISAYIVDISVIYADISASLGVFFLFFHKPAFLCRICVGYIGKLPIYQRYIGDMERFFPIFPRNNFHSQKLCRDGPTPEISTIYRQYFATFLTLPIIESKKNPVYDI